MSLFINDIEDLQHAGLPVDNDTDLDVLERSLVDSELEFVKPVVGDVLFEEIKTGLGQEPVEPEWANLLKYLQPPVAYNGYYRFYLIPGGQLNHRGFHRDQTEYSQAAPKWEIDQLKETLICKADHALDALIDFLTENIADYESWKQSGFFKTSAGLIVPNATIFNEFVQIGCSGRVFQKLSMYRKAAERSLQKIICKPLYERIVSELSSVDLTAEIEDLLAYVRPMVAYETMFRGIKRLGFNYTDTGIYTYSYSDGTLTKTAIGVNEARMLEAGWREDYEDARIDLLDFLKNNIDDYPEYKDSDCYATQPISRAIRYDNSIEKKHFGL